MKLVYKIMKTIFLMLSVLLIHAQADESITEKLEDEYLNVRETQLSFLFEDEEGHCGFIDKKSSFFQRPIYDSVFDEFSICESDPILVLKNNNYYYASRDSGLQSIGPVFNHENPYMEFVNGYAVIDITDYSVDRPDYCYVLIDSSGNTITFPEYISPYGFVNEKGLVRIYHNQRKKFGIGNVYGEMILEPNYEWVLDYTNGYAAVMNDGLWGHVSETGQVMVNPIYKLPGYGYHRGYTFSDDGFAIIILEDGNQIKIDSKGTIIDDSKDP